MLLQRDVYLLDEITSDLDFELKNRIMDYFLNHENLILIIVSHDE
ncbi:MAG: ABC transporter ATP-binding protein [Methanohalobium sp.]